MDKFIELVAILVLTIIGFVLPIISLLLSIFNDGVEKLSIQYTIEKDQSEENIKNQLQKIENFDNENIDDIQSNLEKLKTIRRVAQSKLIFLDPKRQIISLFVPLFASFIFLGSFFIVKTIDFGYTWLNDDVIHLFPPILGLLLFVYSTIRIWRLLGILAEVVTLVNSSKKETEVKIIELLSNLVEKTKSQYDLFLKKVYLRIDATKITDDSFSLNKNSDEKTKFQVTVVNTELRMAKDVELGFVFPTEFLIDKNASLTIFNDSNSQVVRFKAGTVHGNTYLILGELSFTPLKKGLFKIETFIKAENIESIYKKINLNIK